jgi:hypothetical protein
MRIKKELNNVKNRIEIEGKILQQFCYWRIPSNMLWMGGVTIEERRGSRLLGAGLDDVDKDRHGRVVRAWSLQGVGQRWAPSL